MLYASKLKLGFQACLCMLNQIKVSSIGNFKNLSSSSFRLGLHLVFLLWNQQSLLDPVIVQCHICLAQVTKNLAHQLPKNVFGFRSVLLVYKNGSPFNQMLLLNEFLEHSAPLPVFHLILHSSTSGVGVGA